MSVRWPRVAAGRKRCGFDARFVILYVCDQLAIARLPRASFALQLSLPPSTAVVIGFLVLRQVPIVTELLGIVLVIGGIAVHRAEI